jgi:hypothetical protein
VTYAAALVVLDLDEPGRLGSGRTGEDDVDVAGRWGVGGARQPCRSAWPTSAARVARYSLRAFRHRSSTLASTS